MTEQEYNKAVRDLLTALDNNDASPHPAWSKEIGILRQRLKIHFNEQDGQQVANKGSNQTIQN